MGPREYTRHRANPPVAGAVCSWRRASSHGTVRDPRAHRATGARTGPLGRAQGHWGARALLHAKACMRGGSVARGQPLAAQHALVSMPVPVHVAALVLPEFHSSHILTNAPSARDRTLLPLRCSPRRCRVSIGPSPSPLPCPCRLSPSSFRQSCPCRRSA